MIGSPLDGTAKYNTQLDDPLGHLLVNTFVSSINLKWSVSDGILTMTVESSEGLLPPGTDEVVEVLQSLIGVTHARHRIVSASDKEIEVGPELSHHGSPFGTGSFPGGTLIREE